MITSIDNIADVKVSKEPSGDSVYEYNFKDKRVILNLSTKKAYEDALNPSLPFGLRVKRFFTASNSAGKFAKVFKDFALMFFPFGKTVSNVTELVTEQIKRTMPTKEKLKRKSRTLITFGLLFTVGILQQLGLDLGLELSPDAQWVLIGSSIVGVILRLITGKPVKLGPTLRKIFNPEE